MLYVYNNYNCFIIKKLRHLKALIVSKQTFDTSRNINNNKPILFFTDNICLIGQEYLVKSSSSMHINNNNCKRCIKDLSSVPPIGNGESFAYSK